MKRVFKKTEFQSCYYDSANVCSHLFCSVCFRATWKLPSVISCRVSRRTLLRNVKTEIEFRKRH
jgi:hypothetical protein